MGLVFLAIVASVAIVTVFWYSYARERMRHELVMKVLERGDAIDPATLDRLLSRPQAGAPPQRPKDPREGPRIGFFIDFLIGFFTLVYAFTRPAGIAWPLVLLGLLPLVLAFYVSTVSEREFRAGTLPTLTHDRDPREAHQFGGFVYFLIGYATMFVGIVRAAGLSYPLIGLGIASMALAIGVWAAGDREYREGLLTGGVPPAVSGRRSM
ncbi:MAG TPA: hypothetical protein VG871_12750 [Vicinamibacterales bacterium]|nr:hypothetical protein [Vicinamibacterales bacterium]